LAHPRACAGPGYPPVNSNRQRDPVTLAPDKRYDSLIMSRDRVFENHRTADVLRAMDCYKK
jgi:hypothetical protein